MDEGCAYFLNDDCWEVIFKRLSEDRHDFASVSLVCKRFLSITNRLKISLLVSDLTAHLLPRLLKRFHQLKSIRIVTVYHEDVNNLINQILRSGLEVETLGFWCEKSPPRNASLSVTGFGELGIKMKSLKKLSCDRLYPGCEGYLIALTDFFPCLEELGIEGWEAPGCPSITDDGIEVLTSKLKGLKKVSLYGCSTITDKSLMFLSSNCTNLTDIKIRHCSRVTENGIGFLMRRSSKLTSLSLYLPGKYFYGNYQFTIKNSISYARNLEYLTVSGVTLSDEFLCSIANSCPGLKKINFYQERHQSSFTIHRLEMLLRASTRLEEFSPRIRWITDPFMVQISKHLHCLTHINLDGCIKLSSFTFDVLTKSCPSLEEIHMDCTSIGNDENLNLNLHRNYRVKYLYIRWCKLMNDGTLIRFGSICPNLVVLCAMGCQLLTDKGITEFLRICPEIRLLDVSQLNVSNFLVSQHENSKLKLRRIEACQTRISDANMKAIGKTCLDLEHLRIRDCQRITNSGVEEVVVNCKKLRMIDMKMCRNVSIDLLDWMVKSRPSLKKIIPPCDFVPSEEQKILFLHNGCLLLSGV